MENVDTETRQFFDAAFATPQSFGDDSTLFAISRAAYPTREEAHKVFIEAELDYDTDESYDTSVKCIWEGCTYPCADDEPEGGEWVLSRIQSEGAYPVWIFDPTNWYGVPNG